MTPVRRAVYFRPMFSDVVVSSGIASSVGAATLSPGAVDHAALRESLTTPLTHRTYHHIVMHEPLRAPEHAPLTARQRKAINDSLEFASTDNDPVRRLLVTVRAFVLNHTVRSYAPELGMRPHSLLNLEARGFDSQRSVSSVYGKFALDWERRAALDPTLAPFLTWASKRLRALVLSKEYATPLGQLLEWQMIIGSVPFAARTGLDPAGLSRIREWSTMVPFGYLIEVGGKIGAVAEPPRTADGWNLAWIERVRRISIRYSQSIERPIAPAKLGIMLEWAGVPLTVVGLREHFPRLKERDAQRIVKYEPLKKGALSVVLDSTLLVGAIPELDREQLREQMARSQRSFSHRPSSSKKVAEIMRERKMGTRYIADVFHAIEPHHEKDSITRVRSVLFRGAIVEDLPWGRVAGVLARSEREYKNLVTLRSEEIASEYRRRTGQRMNAATLYRKIWGSEPLHEDVTVSDGFANAHHEEPLQRSMEVYLGQSPAWVLQGLHRARRINPLRRETGSGFERLRLLRQAEVVPSLPEFKKILDGARIPFGPFHEIGWRDAFGGFKRGLEQASDFGNVQRRVLKTLIAEKASNTSEFLASIGGVSPQQRVHFQPRGAGREIPLVSFWRALSFSGINTGDPRALQVSLLLEEKSFVKAFRRWYVEGLIGADENIRIGLRDLVAAREPLTREVLFTPPCSVSEVLALKFELDASVSETSQNPIIRRALVVRSVMRRFPGITVDEITQGIAAIREVLHALTTPTNVSRTWKPTFLNAADRKLIEDGLITADRVRRIGLPSLVRTHVRGVVAVVGSGIEQAESPIRVLFPSHTHQSHPKVSEARVAMTHLFAETLHAMNLSPVVAASIFKAFRAAWTVAHIESDSAKVVGAFLDESKVADNEHLAPVEILDAVLKELFSEYRK